MASQATTPTRQTAKPAGGSGFNWSKFFTYLVLITGAIIAIVPFLATISISLMNLTEATSQTFFPSKLQWGNYIEAWQEADFSEFFFNSLQLALITVAGEVVFGVLAAYAFARMKFPGKNLVFALFLTTLTLPQAIQWVPNFLTVSWLGKVTPFQWIDNWPSLTIPFMASAFGIFLLRQFFQQIPEELWDAAQIDGAGHFRYLWQIVIPLSKAPILILALFGFLGSWDSLAWPILVTRSLEWRPIAYGLQSFLQEAGSFVHLQMAGALISILPILIIYFFTQRQFIEAMTRSGLKG